jgi:glutamate racemase
MDNRPVLFLDSGIGGLPYCHHFHRHNPAERLVYVADRAYFPYGPREQGELIGLLIALMTRLMRLFNPKVGVLACNTASVSALAALREAFPGLPLVGTVPAIKPAVLESRKQRTGVLGTERTITDPYVMKLAARYRPECTVMGIAAPDLVEFVEHRHTLADDEERRQVVVPYIERFRAAGVDTVVLGCTHFLFLLEEFRAAAVPDIGVHDSIAGISHRVEALLDRDEKTMRSQENQEDPLNMLVVTGEAPLEPSWQSRADAFGLVLHRLEDLDPPRGVLHPQALTIPAGIYP